MRGLCWLMDICIWQWVYNGVGGVYTGLMEIIMGLSGCIVGFVGFTMGCMGFMRGLCWLMDIYMVMGVNM